MPIHIHVKNADGSAKFTIEPLELTENSGLKQKDVYLAESIIEENKELIVEKWEQYFKKN